MSDNVVIDSVATVPFGTVMAWVAGIFAIFCAIVAIAVFLYKWLEKYRKARNKIDNTAEEFNEIKTDIKEIYTMLTNMKYANQQTIADQLNSRITRYYKLGYIPQEEFPSFQHLYGAYTKVDGNGDMEKRYGKCLDDLEVRG